MTKGLKIEGLDVPTLKNVRLDLSAGQTIGLSGPSGSGKTLLLRALADLDPHEGRMWLDGVAAEAIPACKWRLQVGLLPSESAWWHDTVGPHFDEVHAPWVKALGFDAEVLAWQISRLSSGERQRLGLLRLLMHKPKVLLLDEPTANLDADSIERVEKLVGEYRQTYQPVIIWVSHDLHQLGRNCDAVYVIREGRLEPDGAVSANDGGQT